MFSANFCWYEHEKHLRSRLACARSVTKCVMNFSRGFLHVLLKEQFRQKQISSWHPTELLFCLLMSESMGKVYYGF